MLMHVHIYTCHLQVKNQSVEHIINQWNQDLEEHAKSFLEQANRIQEWDRKYSPRMPPNPFLFVFVDAI